MEDKISIRSIEAGDRGVWMEMWHGYNAFYNVAPPESATAATWDRILDLASPVKALLASDGAGNPLGFANYILHFNTWSAEPVCLLEDLFVRPDARGQGVGGSLIEYLISLARTAGWSRFYWMTREDNVTARRLYDRFCKSDGFVRYSISFDGL